MSKNNENIFKDETEKIGHNSKIKTFSTDEKKIIE